MLSWARNADSYPTYCKLDWSFLFFYKSQCFVLYVCVSLKDFFGGKLATNLDHGKNMREKSISRTYCDDHSPHCTTCLFTQRGGTEKIEKRYAQRNIFLHLVEVTRLRFEDDLLFDISY